MSWTKIELPEPIPFKEDGIWYKIRTIKNYKGHVLCEVERFGTTIMRSLERLPTNLENQIKEHISSSTSRVATTD
jgi:hypothetical protein